METVQLCPPQILSAIGDVRAALEQAHTLTAAALSEASEAAGILGALAGDVELAKAVLVLPALGHPQWTAEALRQLAGAGAVRIAAELSRLGELGLPPGWSPSQGLDARQTESVRKMLLAVVSDPRLMLARLSLELVRLRHAASLAPADRERAAAAARAVFAPLASRLGVWQLKWELEDLAFRHLEPGEYRRIAAALHETRADRERYIESLCAALRTLLAAAGIRAEVYGRPKHLYSIYRKMQRKQLSFDQLYDIRAVRIVVESVSDCYAALGVVHGRWAYVAEEFDDYVATPKDNLYRSIHTAIIGPEGASVEVQIRTREMHEHAELGVAAHWQYKEGGARDLGYERKIEAVRRLLRPGEADGSDRDFLERMRARLFADRVYALTPKGDVIELPRGATPLDFAYHVHSDLGHRCRGAKVNGRIVPLTHAVSNGEVIEILTSKQPQPSRDWLAPELGYLASARSRSKVRAWFRRHDSPDGRLQSERALTAAQLPHAARQPPQAAGRPLDRAGTHAGTHADASAAAVARRKPRRPSATPRSAVEVEGVGDLPITLARCCGPLRPQPIAGYVTVGRGVTVHLASCPSLARMQALKPKRVLHASWTGSEEALTPVELAVAAQDRRGLVRDLTDLILLERLSIEALTTTTDRGAGTAQVSVRLGVRDLDQLARLTRRFKEVKSVLTVARTR